MFTSKHKNRLIAEWEPQAATQLTWPHKETDWADHLEQVLPLFAHIGAAISQDQILLSVCRDNRHQHQVANALINAKARLGNLRYALADSNDVWARDHGPISTQNGNGVMLHDFQFDAWGKKYAAQKDNQINRQLQQQKIFGDTPMQHHDWVLEGGAIETDGQGTLLATRSSVLDRRRNPGLDQTAIQQRLRQHLGITRFLWLAHGALGGDDTDAHIDMLVRFTGPQTLVYSTAPQGDTNHAELAAMRDELGQFRTQRDTAYRLVALPFPGVHQDAKGRRLPASYANYLLTNYTVLLPAYGVAQDRRAAAILADCFPTRRVKLIDCRALIQQNGSLHCLTMPFYGGL